MLRKVVYGTPLELFQARLDGTLSYLVYWKLPLSVVGFELDDLEGDFQPKPFFDSAIFH